MSGINFPISASVDGILQFIRPKIEQVQKTSKYGVTVDVSPTTRRRSIEQNRYLWGIYSHIVDFYFETGFVPDALPIKFLDSDFLHRYFKLRFDIKESKKLSTAEFCQYCDRIQQLMTEQTKGVYDPIYPEEPLSTYED